MGKLPHSVLLAVAAAAATSAYADDGAVTGSASVTGLSYHLVDLNPTDGVTPWITFNSSSYVGVGSATISTDASNNWQISSDPHVTSGNIFSSMATTYQSPDGSMNLGYGPTGASVTANVSGTILGNLNSGGSGTLYSLDGAAGMAYGSQSTPFGANVPASSSDVSFTLSPNTALVIDGNVQASVSMDLSKLGSGTTLIQGIQSGRYTANVNTIIGGGVAFIDDQGALSENQLTQLVVGQSLDASGVHDDPNGYPSSDSSVLTPFEVTYTNNTANTRNGGLVAGVGIVTNITLNKLQTPDVPEPGTWALMGLGLAGLGVVTRKRRQTV